MTREKNSARIALRMMKAMKTLSNDIRFTSFINHWEKTKHNSLPETPLEMRELYNQFHAPFLQKSINPHLSHKQQIEIGIKDYIESWALYPIQDLIQFYAGIIAQNVLVSKNWILNTEFKGLIRCRSIRNDFPILMTDASAGLGYDPVRKIDTMRVGGGAALFHLGSLTYRCGRLPILPNFVLGNAIPHPLTGARVVIYELLALLNGLKMNKNHVYSHKLGVLIDSQDLFRVLTGVYSIPEDYHYPDFMAVISELRRLEYFVCHIYREQNLIADRLAYLARFSNSFLDHNWHDWDIGWTNINIGDLPRIYSSFQNFVRVPASSLEKVIDALSYVDLKSLNVIVGIDFTNSNQLIGAKSFNKRCLHHIGREKNPYELAISSIGMMLSKFVKQDFITYGFGDAFTLDQEVFSLYPGEIIHRQFAEVLARYHELVPQLHLAGPKSFAPIIEMAITTVEKSRGQYHVLLIIADGQVTRSVDTGRGQLSPQEEKTVEAIVKASQYPLSIILVGVGDGPWDMMREFTDNIPARAFDNFQFVNFTEIMSKNVDRHIIEAEFAFSALDKIRSQYNAILKLNLLRVSRGNAISRVALPPPSPNNRFQPSAPSSHGPEQPVGTS